MLPLVLFFLILVSSPCVISIAVPSTSRLTNHDASWDLAIREGSRLSQQLESGCYPDTNPLNLGALLAIGFRFGDEWHEEEHIWPPVFKVHSGFESEVVKFLKWTEKGEAYWTVGVFRMFFTPWKDSTTYRNEYSPKNGLIAALDINKAAGETVLWSDVTFAMWEAITAYTKTNIKHLRYIAHHGIDNLFTNLIIDRAINGRTGQHIQVKRFGVGTEAFLALLGTPSGARSVYLLMQHKRQLGRKTIAEVVVFGDHSRDLVFVLRDMPIPRINSVASMNSTALEACFELGGERDHRREDGSL